MISLVAVGTQWSVARIEPDEGRLEWWCGRDGWVDPGSSFWAFMPSCRNEVFATVRAAAAFARRQGWLR